ncbi:MAG: hypothetical protein QXW52_06845 [Candidatus Caldarchaeum sp.]
MEAMKALASKVGGEVVNVVKDYYGNAVKVIAGIKAPGIRGFGIVATGNEVKVVGDDYGCKIKLQEFAGLFHQTYTAIAIKKSLTKLGYSVSTKEDTKTVYVYGVKV